MKACLYQLNGNWVSIGGRPFAEPANLVIATASRDQILSNPIAEKLQTKFPAATYIICSTAGEIAATEVVDDSITVTALSFASTRLQGYTVNAKDYANSFEAGKALIENFEKTGLQYILVFSDGSLVNGSELVRGINAVTEKKVLVTGGLAGDGDRFEKTLVGLNGEPEEGKIAAVGFYGEKLEIRHGSQGGWETFGMEKIATRSEANKLFEIDDQTALTLYKKFLGPESKALPGSALLFPLSVYPKESSTPVVRTILSINEEEGSMTFAGDIPEGSRLRLMKANFDRLTSAAAGAAHEGFLDSQQQPVFALLISCVGRKLILQSRIDEEVEAVDEAFGHKTLLSGFYSYGEISPLANSMDCQLHNQTMTITTFYEHE